MDPIKDRNDIHKNGGGMEDSRPSAKEVYYMQLGLPEEFVTIKRATEFLGLTSNTEVERLIKVGKLPAVELPHAHGKKTWRISRDDLVKYDDFVKQKRREYIEKIQSEINDREGIFTIRDPMGVLIYRDVST